MKKIVVSFPAISNSISVQPGDSVNGLLVLFAYYSPVHLTRQFQKCFHGPQQVSSNIVHDGNEETLINS